MDHVTKYLTNYWGHLMSEPSRKYAPKLQICDALKKLRIPKFLQGFLEWKCSLQRCMYEILRDVGVTWIKIQFLGVMVIYFVAGKFRISNTNLESQFRGTACIMSAWLQSKSCARGIVITLIKNHDAYEYRQACRAQIQVCNTRARPRQATLQRFNET